MMNALTYAEFRRLANLLPWLDRWQAGWLGWAGYVGLLGLSALHARVFLDTPADDPVADRLLRVGAWLWLVIVPLLDRKSVV